MAADPPPRFLIGALAAAGVVLMAVGVARRASAPPPAAPPPAPSRTAEAATAGAAKGPSPASLPFPRGDEAAPTVIPAPTRARGRPLTKAEFLENPELLVSDQTDVGGCRLVQHWDTGYCYVWSRSYGRKISQTTDARCDDLPELRRRMRAAIERGDCE